MFSLLLAFYNILYISNSNNSISSRLLCNLSSDSFSICFNHLKSLNNFMTLSAMSFTTLNCPLISLLIIFIFTPMSLVGVSERIHQSLGVRVVNVRWVAKSPRKTSSSGSWHHLSHSVQQVWYSFCQQSSPYLLQKTCRRTGPGLQSHLKCTTNDFLGLSWQRCLFHDQLIHTFQFDL